MVFLVFLVNLGFLGFDLGFLGFNLGFLGVNLGFLGFLNFDLGCAAIWPSRIDLILAAWLAAWPL